MTTQPVDPSLRFVLPDDAPLTANLAMLWAADPEIAAQIEQAADCSACQIEPAKSGELTLAVRDASTGKAAYLHSRYQPGDEARKLVDGVHIEQNVVFFIYGFGLGYHAQQLFDRTGPESIFFVFEPDVTVLRTAFEHFDYSKLIDSRRVLFFTSLEKGPLFVKLTQITAMIAVGSTVVRLAASVQRHRPFFAQLDAWLEEFASFGRTSMNTLLLNSKKTAENIAANIGWYAASPDISLLKDRHKNQPAIIVSAGPSLRKNKHLLKDAAKNAVIIAVQTTLQPLVELGVEPDYVTSLDYHEICTRFFEKLPKTLRTQLVAEPKATDRIFDLNPGPLWLLGSDFADSLLPELSLDRTRLQAGATVAHLAFYLAQHLGCGPIIFVGQDLGFSDGLCYAPGTSYDDVWQPELGRFCTVETKQWEQIARDKPILRKIPDHAGRPMYTEERLFAYLSQFERDFLQSDHTIIDATEGGARKRGSTPMKLADALAKYATSPIDRGAMTHPGLNWNREPEVAECLAARKADAQAIEQISRDTLPLLQQVRDHLDDQPRVNRLIGQIDLLRSRVSKLDRTYNLITQLTQSTEMDRFRADRKLAATANLDALEKQRRQVDRDLDNVRSVMAAAKEFQLLMDSVIARVSATRPRKVAVAA